MSRIVATKLGRFRAVSDGDKKWWLWECPRCKTWGNLSWDQMEGRASVYCDVRVLAHYGLGPPNDTMPCGYHETHEFAKELVTAIQVKTLFGENPFEEEAVT